MPQRAMLRHAMPENAPHGDHDAKEVGIETHVLLQETPSRKTQAALDTASPTSVVVSVLLPSTGASWVSLETP